MFNIKGVGYVRVGAGVGHGQQTGAVVGQLEVLIGKLLAVDGLATGTLKHVSFLFGFGVSGYRTLPRVKSPP